jgi:hypothetical protein
MKEYHYKTYILNQALIAYLMKEKEGTTDFSEYFKSKLDNSKTIDKPTENII